MNEQHVTLLPGYHSVLFTPEDAYASEKLWPLIVFLHGVGERGNDLNAVTRQGLPRVLKRRHSFPFVTVAPQLPDNEYWIPSLVDEVIPLVQAQARIDEDRT